MPRISFYIIVFHWLRIFCQLRIRIMLSGFLVHIIPNVIYWLNVPLVVLPSPLLSMARCLL